MYFLEKAVQHPNSEFCGLFVVGFLKAYQNGNITNFLKKFKKVETMKNDKIIYTFLKNHINRQL